MRERLCVRVSDEIKINYILKTQEEEEEEDKQLVNYYRRKRKQLNEYILYEKSEWNRSE